MIYILAVITYNGVMTDELLGLDSASCSTSSKFETSIETSMCLYRLEAL